MITHTISTPKSDVGYLHWKTSGQAQQLEVGEFLTIGRDTSSQVVVESPFASLRHARIERKESGFLLRDLRSRNGTFVNGARILEAVLCDGDCIQIGDLELQFSWDKGDASDGWPLVSRNVAWNAQLQRLPNIAHSNFPVLLTGPSGTGKDILARAIHRLSGRRHRPFVSVNCSALSESLVESELFGHVRGSFTGATGDRKGAFSAARGGTLFLDEIGDLPLSLQPKLLRALENRQIRPVGSDQSVETDVRIITATHHDLKRMVFEERFRADLYFRLHVVQVSAPALTERMEDFNDLFYGFARQLKVRFSFAAIEKLKEHNFPGNIRELRNLVARAKAVHGTFEVGESDIDQLIDVLPDFQSGSYPGSSPEYRPSRSVIKEIEMEMIRSRLVANRGNQRKTASDLGMAKSTLHDRIRTYGIDLEKILDSN